MSWKSSLRQHLAEGADVQALVGARVQHNRSAQGDPAPRVVFYATTVVEGHTLTEADGLPGPRVRVECFGRTSEEAEAVKAAVKARLNGFRGQMGDVFVQSCLVTDGGQDDYLPPPDGSDRGDPSVILEVSLSYEETVPTF